MGWTLGLGSGRHGKDSGILPASLLHRSFQPTDSIGGGWTHLQLSQNISGWHSRLSRQTSCMRLALDLAQPAALLPFIISPAVWSTRGLHFPSIRHAVDRQDRTSVGTEDSCSLNCNSDSKFRQQFASARATLRAPELALRSWVLRDWEI